MNKVKLNSGLLEMFPPLIENIAHLRSQQPNSENFDDLMLSQTKEFVEASHICIAVLDLDFNIITASSQWEKWFKNHLSTKNFTQNKSIQGLNFFELTAPCSNAIEKALISSSKGKTIRYEVLEYKTKRKKRFIKWESIALKDKNSNPSYIMVFSEDITHEQELIVKHKKLHDSNIMLQNFAMIFSHDLIQPMKQISNFTTLLEGHLNKLNVKDPLIEYTFKSIDESISQMRNLAEGIIFYCKQGELTTKAQPTSLKSVVEEVMKSCLKMTSVHFQDNINEDVLLFANKACLLQLFQNLLTNAVKHSPSTKPIVTISGFRNENNYYQIDFHNFGVCPPHLKKELFKPFVSSFSDGAGLGLMICKKIVNAYNGTIKISSSIKAGTTVSVNLPLIESSNSLPKKVEHVTSFTKSFITENSSSNFNPALNFLAN